MVYGLRDAQGSDSLMTMRIFQFLQAWDKNSPLHRAFAVRNFESPMLDLMAVKYVVAAEPLSEEESKGLRLVHAGDLWVYENAGSLPRAFVVPNWVFVKSSQDALRKIHDPNFDPREMVVLEKTKDEKHEEWEGMKSTSCPLSPVPRPIRFKDSVNKLSINVTLKTDSALIVADGAYPGWRAFGRERESRRWQQLPTFIANYAFRAAILPTGSWQVVWVYFPEAVIIGLFLSLTAIAATAAIFTARFGSGQKGGR